MVDPVTVNILLSVPTRGSDSGTWDTPVNGDFNSIDGRFGGVQTIAVSGSTTLTAPSGSPSPAGGPTQAENCVIKFTGTLASNATITLPLPGRYTLVNACLGSAVVLRAVGSGKVVGLPPGEPIDVWNDGTNCDFANLGRVGSYMDLAVSAIPTWMTACTVAPYLICDGAIYNNSVHTALGLVLGSTFGGNGVTTFGTPDLRGRYRIPLDNQGGSAASRITSAAGGAGIDGTVLGTSGGNQNVQTHSHGQASQASTFTYTVNSFGVSGGGSTVVLAIQQSGGNTGPITTLAGAAGTTANYGAGSSGNIPPGLVAGISFIKT